MKLKIIVIFNLLLCCFVRSDDERVLSVQLNPDCKNQLDATQCDDISFVHISAESSQNTLHYIWDFTGLPSLFLAKTAKNTSLHVDWNSFLLGEANSVNFSSTPELVFSAVIHKVLLFEDAGDKANVNDGSVKDVTSLDPHLFHWKRQNLTQAADEATIIINAAMNETDGSSNINGTIAVKLSAFGSTKHGAELPHLFHSSHSMQMDIVAQNITSNYTHPRIAITFLLVSSESKSEGSFKLKKRRNLDDEFTPGIFDVFDVVSPRSTNGTQGAFLQYRPVCYTTSARTVSGSTELKQGEIRDSISNDKELDNFKNTLPYSYYGFTLGSKVAQGTNITFGLTGDGFYSRSNYTSFSMLLGFGAPPVEKLSAFVITFAAIGLGVPLLVLLIGGTYVGVKRYSN